MRGQVAEHDVEKDALVVRLVERRDLARQFALTAIRLPPDRPGIGEVGPPDGRRRRRVEGPGEHQGRSGTAEDEKRENTDGTGPGHGASCFRMRSPRDVMDTPSYPNGRENASAGGFARFSFEAMI